MSKRAPTSTPCVGSSARMTLTSPRRKGRVSETFCWLPPERDCTGCSTDAIRIRRRRTRPSMVRRSRRRRTTPRRPSRRRTWIVVLARTLSTGKSDSRARSPLSNTTPARSAATGDFVSSASPLQEALPVGRSTPASARRNCTWPLPSAPAIPRISPLSTLRSMGPKRSPRSPETSRSTSEGRLSWSRSGKASWSGRPIMRATSAFSDMSAASYVPWLTPSRRTVTRSAIPSTSGSRWLT